MKRRTLFHKAGFTLGEMMVSVLCFILAGGIVFLLLNSGMILYAKNMSMNTAHQDTRRSMNRLLRDIHASVSVPYLIDANFNAVSPQPYDGSGNPTGTPGVCFQLVAQGPNYVWKDPSASSLIMIYDGGNHPAPGQRLIIPLWGIEADITKYQESGCVIQGTCITGHDNLWLLDATGQVIDQGQTAGKSPNYKSPNSRNSYTVYAITYYTDRVAYIVQNGQLKLYYHRYLSANSSGTGGTWSWVSPRPKYGDPTNIQPSNWDTNGVVIARDITSSTPFTIPLNSLGTPDDRYVRVQITATDPTFSNRKLATTSSLMDASIPYRSRLCSIQ